MTVRVRFAPSPTGYIHIGGARTALYNYLYAQAHQGTFVLRIEDTDAQRSKREYEEAQLAELAWLGIDYHEGPGKEGKYGPYRQSERGELYQKKAQELLDQEKAYYCFCTEEELATKKEQAKLQGKPPHYDGKCRGLSNEEALSRLATGEPAVVRFKAPQRSYTLKDEVRGRIVFPENMVGDFVLMRSGGVPVYNFCCALDDMAMDITHVIRGEDHLSNTVRQLMIYEAFEKKPPHFAHVSLLVGKDRQKLSKRHGATSVFNYREKTYLPQAINNYLTLLGWSHPEEKDVFNVHELGEKFDARRFSKAPAVFDLEKFEWINGQHIRSLAPETIQKELQDKLPPEHLYFSQSDAWQKKAILFFQDQVHFFSQYDHKINEFFEVAPLDQEEVQEILSWDSTAKMFSFLQEELAKVEGFASEEDFTQWQTHLKKELAIKGKPLFMGMRFCLTGKKQGGELKEIIPLTPVAIIRERIKKLESYFA